LLPGRRTSIPVGICGPTAAPHGRFPPASLGDEFRDHGGFERIGQIRSFYPFGRHGAVLVETSLGHVALSTLLR
jgi:hypothetical protein